uniref:hypothetical protein n=1 Tax=Burkholderia diffusa TaxID=488732 RepID=UPI001CC8057C|nr:hypothetical protein [Burkholderia diffusa]
MQAKNSVQCSERQPATVNSRFWEVGEYGFVIDELLSFLRAILSTEHAPFDLHHAGVTKYASPNTLIVHGLNSLDYYFHGVRDFMSIVMPGYAYSPLLRLFQASFLQHPWLCHCSFRNPSSPLSVVPLLEAEVFNDFVQMLRTRARLQDTWLHMRRWKSDTERSQAESIEEYVPKLLSGGDRLEPIRVDFQYQENVFTLADAMPFGQWGMTDTGRWSYEPVLADCPEGKPESRARIDTRVAMQDRARFFANIYRDADRQILQYMRGYLSKMERGANGANHFHCCFFLDASRPVRVTTQAVIDVISSRWLRATRGRGLVFSCHEPNYRQALRRQGRWALDPLAAHNQRQVTQLTDYLVRYFARDKDQSIHVKPAARSRALTMAVGRASTSRT